MKFGFTNDQAQFDAVCAWRDAAVADGWTKTKYYNNEPIEDACQLSRDGFLASVLTRRRTGGRWRFEAIVRLWGPDGPVIDPGTVYNWDEIKAGLKHCPRCGAKGVETTRVAFANRTCLKCLPEARAVLEFPGWCD